MQDVNDELEEITFFLKKKKHFYAYRIFIEKSSYMNSINSNIVFFYFMYLLLLNHVM